MLLSQFPQVPLLDANPYTQQDHMRDLGISKVGNTCRSNWPSEALYIPQIAPLENAAQLSWKGGQLTVLKQ